MVDLRRRQAGRVITGHQRRVLDRHRGERQLVEQVQRAGGVDHLQRERVFVAADAANLLAVPGLRDHRHRRSRPTAGPPGDAAASAPASRGRSVSGRQVVRIHDLLAQSRCREAPGIRQVASAHAPSPVHFMTGRALRAAEKQRLAGGRIAGHRRAGCWRILGRGGVLPRTEHPDAECGWRQDGESLSRRAGHRGLPPGGERSEMRDRRQEELPVRKNGNGRIWPPVPGLCVRRIR